MPHTCIIALASNCDQERNLAEARLRLSQILHGIRYSSELWTEPIHSKRTDLYLNQLAYAHVSISVVELQHQLKNIEGQMGRTEEARKEGIVYIDLDLMQYDLMRYHLRDWERPYIQRLLV